MKKEMRYLVPEDYMADPAVHVFNGKVYIYPSHDRESGIPENDNGDHFNMKDYHVFSTDDVMHGEIKDHGVVLATEDIPWAGRQLWDCDVALKDGKYYMYFPLKDRNDIFRIGVAVSDSPEGPFIPQPDPIRGSYSIDPAVLDDGNGCYYMYFGGLWGGQLQRYRDNKALESAAFPPDNEPCIPGRVAKLSDDMLQFAEEPKPVVILDENGKPWQPATTNGASSRPAGCTSTTENTTSPTPPATRTAYAMPSVTILTDLLSIKESSSPRLWDGQRTMPSRNTRGNGIFSTTTAYLPTEKHGFAASKSANWNMTPKEKSSP